MFIGHYGVALALKKYNQKLSLGFLFIAVQLVDIAFFIFLPLGIENARLVPGFTEASPFDLYDLPITHSLVGSLAWAATAFLVVRFVLPRNSTETDSDVNRTALIVGIGVLSHYFLDFLVHTPDLLLVPGIDVKIGLGLWNSIIATVLLELAILLVGGWIYFQSSVSGNGLVGKYGIFAFMIVLVILTIITPFQSFPDMLTTALVSEFLYVLLALIAYWLDSKRTAVK
ncbi:MAG: hypothetical protein ACW97A_01115 [Candidatus Thorarchaeota archaeon]|jgi:hypothetical protein